MCSVERVALGAVTGGASEVIREGVRVTKPSAPALQPAPPPVPTAGDARVKETAKRSKRQSLVTARSGTVSTSQQGDLSPANTDRKSLLGS